MAEPNESLLRRVDQLAADLREVQDALEEGSLAETAQDSNRGGARRKHVPATHTYQFVTHVTKALAHLPKAIVEEFQRVNVGTNELRQQMARSMMLARCRLDDAIEFAIRQYLEALADRSRLDDWSASLASDVMRDLQVRAKRQLDNHMKNLEDLGIEVREVWSGLSFDPALHEVVQTEEAVHDDAVDTIVSAETPAFVWRDEFGQQQVTPAKVVVFISANASAGQNDVSDTDDGQHAESDAA